MKLYNTLTKRKEEFEPLHDAKVGMYVCGVTVYDDCHLGHARSAIVFDILRRWLTARGYRVTYVRNFTDIDDKILARAAKEGRAWQEIAETYIAAYRREMARLGVARPDIEPRATDHIPQMIKMIAGLLEKGVAYCINGDVYYHVAAFPSYGQLAGRKEEELLAGARVEVDPRKKHPMDFALWKSAHPSEPGWQSPWGFGRPGWHIECSAMAIHYLGATFDIHGGGKDLIFPHHENEIAQSCAYTGHSFARYWIHNGFVTVDEEKMSKSLGNFFTIKAMFEQSTCPEPVTAETLRYFLLSTHYRSDLNFSLQGLSEAKAALDNLYNLLQRLEEPGSEQARHDSALGPTLKEFVNRYQDAMDDDLGTPRALAELQRVRGMLNTMLEGLSTSSRQIALEQLKKAGHPLGLFTVATKDWVFRALEFRDRSSRPDVETVTDQWIADQVEARQRAREQKDFATADRIRQRLAEHGIVLEDRPDGTTRWKR
ncbi:MAG: cysteine--tRNA ligase [Nitrospirae bacterium]|nr:MAG: cysteine--tRNA ligase [Nitrospirota bacterium]